MNLPSGGAFSAALRGRRCPAHRAGRMRWSSRGFMAPIRVQNGRLKLSMNLSPGARACGPQRVESGPRKHLATLFRRRAAALPRRSAAREGGSARPTGSPWFMGREQVRRERVAFHEPDRFRFRLFFAPLRTRTLARGGGAAAFPEKIRLEPARSRP